MNIIEIYEKFPTQEICIEHLEQVRWQGQPKCVYCGSDKTSRQKEKKDKVVGNVQNVKNLLALL